MVLNTVLPSLLNLAQIVTILNTTIASSIGPTSTTIEPSSTTGRFYVGAKKEFNSYGRRESAQTLVGK